MPVESSPGGIWDLDPTYPVGSENVDTLDNYMRVRWQALLDTFPNVTAAVTASSTELNKLDGLAGDVVGTSDAQTLTNKTIAAASNTITIASTDLSDTTALTYNADTDVSGNGWVVDEDNMSSDLATKVPTQQSVKAYVDTTTAAVVSSYDAVDSGDSVTPLASGSTIETFTHGLGDVPDVWFSYIECISAEYGYAVGDRIRLYDYGDAGSRISTSANATTVTVAAVGTSILLPIVNKSTNAAVLATPANWRLGVKAVLFS